MTENRKYILKLKLQESRARLLLTNYERTEILKDLIYVATDKIEKISTNGHCIYFNPNWLQKLGETELDFILMHNVMHIHLDHINRPQYYKGKRFHLAVDIIVNSYLSEMGFDYKRLPIIGRIFSQTFYPTYDGKDLSPLEAFACVPFDPDKMPKTKSRNYMIDQEDFWDKKDDRGECGTIVLSPADDVSSKCNFTVKEKAVVGLYKIEDVKFEPPSMVAISSDEEEFPDTPQENPWDNEITYDIQQLRKYKNETKTIGQSEERIERMWERVPHNSLDWRKLLNFFLLDEFNDYSFSPPDRRFDDGEFFLPDFNVKDELPKDVLFFVDTSGSIDENILSAVYAEICGCLNQFDGKLKGYLAFFDTKVSKPIAFDSIEDIQNIVPKGGGGTSFYSIFNFLKKEYANLAPSNIVIFTDGEAEYPCSREFMNFPVLWLFTNEKAVAPWGKSAVVNII